MNFRSVDTYNIKLAAPAASNRSAWDRTYDWAPEECVARMQVVIGTLIAYNIGALAYLRRRRGKQDLANNVSEAPVADAPKPER